MRANILFVADPTKADMAGIGEGDSGAAILNEDDQLVGIGSFYVRPDDGNQFTYPYTNAVVDLRSFTVQIALSRLMKSKPQILVGMASTLKTNESEFIPIGNSRDALGKPRFKIPSKYRLGIDFRISELYGEAFHSRALVVAKIFPNTPISETELRRSDSIVAINDRPITTAQGIADAYELSENGIATLSVIRRSPLDWSFHTIKVPLTLFDDYVK